MNLLPFFEASREETNTRRDAALTQVQTTVELEVPGFHEQALEFVVWFLRRFGPASGERITLACKQAGIAPHDDRAFGPVYMQLARQERITKVGSVRRERGHGTAGGNIWALQPEEAGG